MIPIWIAIVAALCGVAVGYVIQLLMARHRAGQAESTAAQLLVDAKRDADVIRKEAKLHAKDEVIKAREEFETTTKDRRKELAGLEQRIAERETNLDRKVSLIEKKEKTLEDKAAEFERKNDEVDKLRTEVDKLIALEQQRLQQISGMTREQAKAELLSAVEKEVHGEMGSLIRKLQEEAKETAEREAAKIVAVAIQRYSSSHASEIMTSIVPLPNDDMKGRIIGRDGRNIRALEAATGVNLLIDDTPEAVVISGFDSIRREVARQVLEQLITDGRIHPARIEEVVAKVRETMDETIRTTGEEAAYKVDVRGADPELLRMVGRLKFRTSYTQNILQHSIEVGQLMGVMAGELGLDPMLAKRIGLFHDIGKAVDHEVEGGHATIGSDLLKRHGENPILVNAVAAHHEETPAESVYAILCAAADAISSSRPGARSETTEIYLKRLEKLEAVANSFPGVEKCYAIQAGREVRVIVEPTKVDDNGAMVMARNISKKIEEDLQYPGQIRVTVIRETRCVEYAR
ncbi:MAG: ribonuclease Y [bacterium]